MNVHEKLMEVQQRLKAPKGQYNKFGSFYYRSCEDILVALKPILGDVRAALVVSDSVELVGDRHYIVARASFIDIESGEEVSVTAQAREEREKKGMDGSQITGASSSYARKYALNGLFCIDDNKESDTTNIGQPAKEIKCSRCHEQIMDYNDGMDVISAEALAKRSLDMYGQVFCIKCAKDERKRRENEKLGDGA